MNCSSGQDSSFVRPLRLVDDIGHRIYIVFFKLIAVSIRILDSHWLRNVPLKRAYQEAFCEDLSSIENL